VHTIVKDLLSVLLDPYLFYIASAASHKRSGPISSLV
jgi:hypothetical protein